MTQAFACSGFGKCSEDGSESSIPQRTCESDAAFDNTALMR